MKDKLHNWKSIAIIKLEDSFLERYKIYNSKNSLDNFKYFNIYIDKINLRFVQYDQVREYGWDLYVKSDQTNKEYLLNSFLNKNNLQLGEIEWYSPYLNLNKLNPIFQKFNLEKTVDKFFHYKDKQDNILIAHNNRVMIKTKDNKIQIAWFNPNLDFKNKLKELKIPNNEKSFIKLFQKDKLL